MAAKRKILDRILPPANRRVLPGYLRAGEKVSPYGHSSSKGGSRSGKVTQQARRKWRARTRGHRTDVG